MKKKDKIFIAITILAAAVISFFLSPLASKQPDGLEKVAQNLGFAGKAVNILKINYIMADYVFPGIKNSYWQTAFSGFFGVLIILALFALVFGIIILVNKNKRHKSNPISEENNSSFQYKKF
jgi:cobalt/nickel transport protein